MNDKGKTGFERWQEYLAGQAAAGKCGQREECGSAVGNFLLALALVGVSVLAFG